MVKKPSITDVSSGYQSNVTLNENFVSLQEGFENTLSRDGSTPNHMEADLDMNSNDILNTKDMDISGDLTVRGVDIYDLAIGVGSGTVFTTINKFDGDGVTKSFTLSRDPQSRSNTQVHVKSIYQEKDTYSYTPTGRKLTFSEAPPIGVGNIEVAIQESTESITFTDTVNYETRADFVADVAASAVFPAGSVVSADGVSYTNVTSSSVIPDLGGWIPSGDYTPIHFGAAGVSASGNISLEDDEAAELQLTIDAYQTHLEAISTPGIGNVISQPKLNLMGRTYVTASSLDLTHMSSSGTCIEDGIIYGMCTGKAVLDFTGSRQGSMRRVTVVGDQTNTPRIGIQFARSSAGGQTGFCDHWTMDTVKTEGWFETAALWAYGQETSTYLHCEFRNSDPVGSAAFIAGTDNFNFRGTQVTAMGSDFVTPVTGDTSNINNLYLNCTFRHLPAQTQAAITAVSASNPVTLTVADADLFDGGSVAIEFEYGASGQPKELNNLRGIATKTSATTITIPFDSTSWAAFTYTGGAQATVSQSAPTLITGRSNDSNFKTCYVVNYGYDNAVEVVFGNETSIYNNNFEFLMEGYGFEHYVGFQNRDSSNVAKTHTMQGGSFSTFQSRSTVSVLKVLQGTGTAQALKFQGFDINVASQRYPEWPATLFTSGEEADVAITGGSVTCPEDVNIDLSAFGTNGDQLNNVLVTYHSGNAGIAESFVFRTGYVGDILHSVTAGTTSVIERYTDAADPHIIKGSHGLYDIGTTEYFGWGLGGDATDWVMSETSFQPITASTHTLGTGSLQYSEIFSDVFTVGGTGAPTWTSGTAVPTAAAAEGSLYSRTGGTNGDLYVRENGAWVLK